MDSVEEEKVNVVEVVEKLLNEKPKKVKKTRKSKKPKKVSKPKVVSKPKPITLPPILSDELEVRIKYCNKRMFYCKTEADKQRYQAHLIKLRKRRVISV